MEMDLLQKQAARKETLLQTISESTPIPGEAKPSLGQVLESASRMPMNSENILPISE